MSVHVSLRVAFCLPPRRAAVVIGATVPVVVSFTDTAGLPLVPGNPALLVTPPGGTPLLVALTDQGGGVYAADLLPAVAGPWLLRASCSQPEAAALEVGFDILASSGALAPSVPVVTPAQVLLDATGLQTAESAAEAASSAAAAAASAQAAAASAALAADNATAGSGAISTATLGDAMLAWMLSLPTTTPTQSGQWWNNSGLPCLTP